MTIREIFMEMTDKHMKDEISLGQMSSILDTEIVPKKFVDDILEIFRAEEDIENRPMFEGKITTLTDCIEYIERKLKELESEE